MRPAVEAALPAVQFLMLTVYETAIRCSNSLKAGPAATCSSAHGVGAAAGGHPRCSWRRVAHDPATGPGACPIFSRTGRRGDCRFTADAGRKEFLDHWRMLCLQGNADRMKISIDTVRSMCGPSMKNSTSTPVPRRW